MSSVDVYLCVMMEERISIRGSSKNRRWRMMVKNQVPDGAGRKAELGV